MKNYNIGEVFNDLFIDICNNKKKMSEVEREPKYQNALNVVKIYENLYEKVQETMAVLFTLDPEAKVYFFEGKTCEEFLQVLCNFHDGTQRLINYRSNGLVSSAENYNTKPEKPEEDSEPEGCGK